MFIDNFIFLCKAHALDPRQLISNQGWGSKNTFYNWKNGVQSPSVEIVIQIAKYFNVSLDYLLLDKDIQDVLPDDEQELLKFYRTYKDDVGEDEALREFKDILPFKKIDVYQDKVSAGNGIDLETSISKRRKVYGSDIVDKADFAVIVEGESMSPKFHDGDVLLIKSIEHTDIEIGNIGIFIVDGQTAFVKELGDGELVSLNSKKYGNIKFTDHNDFICKGVVLGTAMLLD